MHLNLVILKKMKNKHLHNWTKDNLIIELKKRNYQYGELANRYAELLCFTETIPVESKINSPMYYPKTNDDSVRVGVKANKQEDTIPDESETVEDEIKKELHKGYEKAKGGLNKLKEFAKSELNEGENK